MFHDMTISDLCDTKDHICRDNIYDLYNGDDTSHYKYTLPFLLLHVILFRFINDTKRLVIMNIFSIILISIMIYIHFEYSHTEMCKFPRWCHEGINDKIIDYFYDTTSFKINKYLPGSKIKIKKYKKLNFKNLDYVFLGAWNFKSEIFKKEKSFIRNGGKFITHIPTPKIL